MGPVGLDLAGGDQRLKPGAEEEIAHRVSRITVAHGDADNARRQGPLGAASLQQQAVIVIHRDVDDLPILPAAQETRFLSNAGEILRQDGAFSVTQHAPGVIESPQFLRCMDRYIITVGTP